MINKTKMAGTTKWFDVVAHSVGDQFLTFTCPHCWTKYNQDGQPSKRAKRHLHVHCSNGEKHNRVERRSAHCGSNVLQGFWSVNIHITDETLRSNEPPSKFRAKRLAKMNA